MVEIKSKKCNELLAECDSAVRSAFPDKATAQKCCYSPAAMTAAMTLSCYMRPCLGPQPQRAGKGSMALLQHCPSIAHHQLRHGSHTQ
eukprot:7567232-Ditylum_brightwellii.AAC.1